MNIRRPSRVRFGVLGFACSLSLLTYLDRVCISRAAEDIERDLAISETQMGWVFSAFLVGYLLFEVPGGLMGDWWGSRRVLTRIVLWWSLFTTLTGCVWLSSSGGSRLGFEGWSVPVFLDALGLLFLIRLLFGAGEAGAYPNLTRVVKGWFPFGERALAQGTIWMSARLGGAVAPLILGRLSALLGWRMAFAVLGAVGVLWASAFFLWFRDSPTQMPACNDAERDLIDPPALAAAGHDRHREPSEGGAHAWPPLRPLASSLTLWGLSLAAFCVSFGWYFYPTWQPKYLKDVFGISYEGSELLTGLPFLCGALGALVGGSLSDHLVRLTGSRRWGRSLVGLTGFAGAGLCILAAACATAAWQAVTLLSLAAFINDLAIPVIWASCADIGGRFSGTVAGVMNMVGGLGGVLSPVLIPQARQALAAGHAPATTWALILGGLALAWLVGAAAWLVVDASKPLFQSR
jgi:MFS family permease